MRVLIIEDDMILALSLEIMLKRIGYKEVKKAHTGEKALETIVDFEPDLMLVDIFLGAGISGIDVVKRYRKKKMCLLFTSPATQTIITENKRMKPII